MLDKKKRAPRKLRGTRGKVSRDGQLLHQEHAARAFDGLRHVALLDGGKLGNATRQNFARVGDMARE